MLARAVAGSSARCRQSFSAMASVRLRSEGVLSGPLIRPRFPRAQSSKPSTLADLQDSSDGCVDATAWRGHSRARLINMEIARESLDSVLHELYRSLDENGQV